MEQRGRVDTAVLVQEDVPRLGGRVTGGALGQALLEAARGLVEQRPRVLLADRRVEGLQDLLQADALRPVQGHLRPAGRPSLAHHRATRPTDHPYFRSPTQHCDTIDRHTRILKTLKIYANKFQ